MRYAHGLICSVLSASILSAGCGGNRDAGKPPTAGRQKSVTLAGSPTAGICDCADQIFDLNQDVTLSGGCSSSGIQTFEWDFDYDAANGFSAQAVGPFVTKVGGYALYGSYPVALRVTDGDQQTS